jgi:phage recombination protein Bet
MANESVKQQSGVLAMSDTEVMDVLRNSLYPGAKDESIKMVMQYCRAAGLDVMQKPVHIVPIWDSKLRETRDVVMPGIGLYRTQAARSGTYAGMSEPEFGADVTENLDGTEMTYPKWCKIMVKRILENGYVAEFPVMEFWKENYAVKKNDTSAPNAMWKKRPYAQLAKCAKAQALREAFPEVGAQPTAEEMEGKEIEVFDTPAPVRSNEPEAPKSLPHYSDESFNKNFDTWAEMIRNHRKTASGIIMTVSSKAAMSEKQKELILNVEAENIEDAREIEE